jgi:hypothetical protein
MSVRHSNYRCVEKRPAKTVDEGQYPLNSILLPRAACDSLNEPDESRTGTPTFIEDYLLEHSPIGQHDLAPAKRIP